MILFSCEAVAPLLLSEFPDAAVCALPPDGRLASPVSGHPDMLLFTDGNVAVVEESYARFRRDRLAPYLSCGRMLTAAVPRGKAYPNDIGLNALAVGRFIFCNAAHTAKEILACGKEIVDVRQGYAACSALVLSSSCIVTADPSIARAAEKHGIDVVSVRPGFVRLPGYDTGFVGGASARVGNTVCFFGDPSSHPDFSVIESACARLHLHIRTLGEGPLTDLGGVRVLL